MILSIDQIKYPLTGIGRYTFELAKQLVRMPEIENLRFSRGVRLCDSIPSFAQAIPLPAHTSGTLTVVRKLLKSRLVVALSRFVKPRLKARGLRGLEDHIFHGPSFSLPVFAGRSVVTIHDLSLYTLPDCHPPERVRRIRAEIELSLKRASFLITDSEFTRLEIASFFGWPLEKIRAIQLASAEEFYPRASSQLVKKLECFGLTPNRYCLFTGTIEPRKNIGVLLDAYAMMPTSIRRRWPLVLVGHEGWNSRGLHERIVAAEREGWVRYLGFVSAEDLPLLFAGARLFVFPSLYEGFGLPVLEAMASGVPVVCSNSSSLPEVVGDAAAMCEPLDTDALKELILQGLEDESWRSIANERGLARAALYSWDRCARETVAVYRNLEYS